MVERYLPHEFLTKVVNGAAAGGQVEILQWLYDDHYDRACWGGVEMCRALTNGHSEAAQWLRTNTSPRPESLKKIMQAAGTAGNVDVIWWLYEDHYAVAEDALWSAQLGSKWGTVRWIFENCELEDPTIHWSAAARCGELTFLKYAYALDVGRPNKDTMHAAATGGHLDVLEWLHSVVGLPLRSEAARNAAENGHLEVVQWIRDNGCPGWEDGIMNAAASGGHLDVLTWLHDNCSEVCDASTMYRAARSGSLDVVEWVNDHYMWEDSSGFAMYTAARSGRLEIVKWLHANRTECSTAVMDGTARFGHLEVLKWLQLNRTEGCTVQAMNWAAGNGHLEIVKWLHDMRSEGCSAKAMDEAASNGHLAVVKWLHYNRSEGCTRDAMTKAIKNGNFEVVLFLAEHRSEGFDFEVTVLHIPCLELTQWLLANYPEQMDGWVFVIPSWDWHFSEWCREINLQRTPEAVTAWICDSAVLRHPAVSIEFLVPRT